MTRLEELKSKLKNEHMPLLNLKVFSNAYGVNFKIDFINSLEKGIRGTCSRILDFFEARVNTDMNDKKYMIIYASQQEIANTLNLSREYISYCINRMVESNLCVFTKVRQGLNKSNYYIMQKKKELVEILKEIFKLQQEEKVIKNQEKQKEINQCMRHFYKSEYAYDVARKSLRELEKKGILQSYQHSITGEKVYYYDKMVSAHDLYILEFYSLLVEYGCTNIEFDMKPDYLKRITFSDGFFKFEHYGYLYICLIEVDLTHKTSFDKFQLYEKLYRDDEFQRKYGTFPFIAVMSFEACLKYESKNFEVVYLPFDLANFKSKILGTA